MKNAHGGDSYYLIKGPPGRKGAYPGIAICPRRGVRLSRILMYRENDASEEVGLLKHLSFKRSPVWRNPHVEEIADVQAARIRFGARLVCQRKLTRSEEYTRWGFFYLMPRNNAPFVMKAKPRSVSDMASMMRKLHANYPEEFRRCVDMPQAYDAILLAHRYTERQRYWTEVSDDYVSMRELGYPLADRLIRIAAIDFGDDQREHLARVAIAAHKFGIDEDTLVDDMDRVAGHNQRSVNVLYALRSLTLLRIARRLHRKNIARGGSGIAPMFKHFASRMMRLIRNGRIRFGVLEGGTVKQNVAGTYDRHDRMIRFSPLDYLDGPDVMSWMDVTVHELYHAYQYDRDMNLSAAEAEMQALSAGYKAGLLVKRPFRMDPVRQAAGEDRNTILAELRELMQGLVIDQSMCLGYTRDESVRRAGRRAERLSLERHAVEGLDEELDGASRPDAHELLRTYAAWSLVSGFDVSRYYVGAGWVYDGGNGRMSIKKSLVYEWARFKRTRLRLVKASAGARGIGELAHAYMRSVGVLTALLFYTFISGDVTRRDELSSQLQAVLDEDRELLMRVFGDEPY